MKNQKGFGLVGLLIILGLVMVGGGAYLYLQKKPISPGGVGISPEPKIPTATSSPEVPHPLSNLGPTASLLAGYKDVQFRYMSGIPQVVAKGICSTLFADTCIWNAKIVTPAPFYVNGTLQKQPSISISSPNSGIAISYGTITPITFSDPGPTGRHRAYFIHRNLLGEVDEVHEAHLVDGDSTGGSLTWDGNEVYVNESGTEQISQLAAGHYYLAVVNIDTGVWGATSGWVNLVTDVRGKDVPVGDLLKPYVVPGTPILNSYWDGRGVFYDGKGGVDTLTLVGKRSDVAIYRGIDDPSKNQYNVLVLYRRTDNVVVVVANVEVLKFDDITLNTADIISQLSNQSGFSVTGMAQFTDINFGFSFWYPNSWTVKIDKIPMSGYGTSLIQKTITVSSGTTNEKVSFDEVYSPNRYVELTQGAVDESFLFDPNTHTWMHGSANGQPASAADVSTNTMGGLHILAGSSGPSAQYVVPLSAHTFLITHTGTADPLGLVRTLVATDPSVATPVSEAEQQSVIESEKYEYSAL